MNPISWRCGSDPRSGAPSAERLPRLDHRNPGRPGTLLLPFLALTLLLVSPIPAGAEAPLRIEIPEAVTVTGDPLRLAELAAEIDGPPALVQAAKDAVLGRAPRPGRTRRLRARTIATRLERIGLSPDRLEIAAPPLISVTRAARRLSRDTVAELARKALERRLADRPEAEVVSVRASRDAVLPAGGPVTARAEIRGSGDLLGTVPLTLHFARDGRTVGDAPVTARVAVYGDVVVARRPIPRHAPLGPDVLTLRRMDLADAPARHFETLAALEGTRATRRIAAGRPLRPDLAERPPAVQRGDRVRILARKPGLEISALGEIRTPGAVGDRVQVVNVDSGKRLEARVLSGDAVAVDF